MKSSPLFYAATALFVLCAFTQCKKKEITPVDNPGTETPVVPPPAVAETPVIFEQTELLSAESEKKRLQLSWLATDFSATGLYVTTSSIIKVNVEQQAGTRLPTLLIGTYSRYGTWNTQPVTFNLKAGLNEITSTADGLIWIRYTNDNPNAKAKLTFTGGVKKVPYYIAGTTTNAQWKDMLSKLNTVPDVILQGERCMIVVDRASAIKYQEEDQEALLSKISRIIKIEDDFSGLNSATDLDKPNVHQRYLLTQHEDKTYYMFAYNYRTAYIGTAISAILKPADVTWGPWHELGHLHQQVWTWGAIGEVTVNIFSRAVQREFTPNENRLVSDKIWEQVPVYLALPDAQRNFNNDAASVWVRLCMFEQLGLAFGSDFYPKLLRKTRLDKPVVNNDDQKMNYFMKSACVVSGKNLSTFFKKWGLNVNSTVYAEIAALGLPQPAQDISLLKD
ncbi:M60 family metallopeptidase [Pedobacter frigoris]|uniref:M60 family metallopeptidase n=1 Tax=Pedobacter frigoris TaxID=2571272 RepID=UPI00292DB01B|nr:M60 family metallopeptidase [Pedobacter frigoris]